LDLLAGLRNALQSKRNVALLTGTINVLGLYFSWSQEVVQNVTYLAIAFIVGRGFQDSGKGPAKK